MCVGSTDGADEGRSVEEARVEEIGGQSARLELVGTESEDGGGETGLEEGGFVGGKKGGRGGGDEGVRVFLLGLLVGLRIR